MGIGRGQLADVRPALDHADQAGSDPGVRLHDRPRAAVTGQIVENCPQRIDRTGRTQRAGGRIKLSTQPVGCWPPPAQVRRPKSRLKLARHHAFTRDQGHQRIRATGQIRTNRTEPQIRPLYRLTLESAGAFGLTHAECDPLVAEVGAAFNKRYQQQ